MSTEERQTRMAEWSDPNQWGNDLYLVPFELSTELLDTPPGSKVHLVHEETPGATFCGQWQCEHEPIESEQQLREVWNDLCLLCTGRLNRPDLELLVRLYECDTDQ